MKSYFTPSEKEKQQLIAQKCTATDWNAVWITDKTDLSKIQNTTFSGCIRIGAISGENTAFGGVVRPNGIYNTHLHNCTIGDHPFIANIKNYIANYRIGAHVVIENVGHIAVEGEATFGNGTVVEAINEGGGREILIYDHLSAQLAYIQSLYRHRKDLIAHLKEMIHAYTNSVKSDMGTIGDHVKILNCRSIKDVNIGSYAKLEGVVSLQNGSLNSYKDAPIYIGSEVMAENFIISSDTIVDNATLLTNCFVGQGCTLDKHYSAEHSVFFANSQGFNGEACSIFAGPYTVTHHKSTLLIAGMFSFMNAGSGSNQSNHMYKLGPIHQGIMERGAKTTSNSYILWPSKIGAFTLVSGRHYHNVDSSIFPFSYLIEAKDESMLFPGINLKSVGTVRDAQKWVKRDKRHKNHQMDLINFNLLSPFTIHKVVAGLEALKDLQMQGTSGAEEYRYGAMRIKANSLRKGIAIYTTIIDKFLGNSVISRIQDKDIRSAADLRTVLRPSSSVGMGKWLDVSGLICPLESLNELLCKIEDRSVHQLSEVSRELEGIHKNYYEYEWNWATSLIEKHYQVDLKTISPKALIGMVSQWKKAVVKLDEMLYQDAQKEFSLSTQVSFGVDGDLKERELDFSSVRGNFENNPTVLEIQNHIERKTALGDRVIAAMEKLQA